MSKRIFARAIDSREAEDIAERANSPAPAPAEALGARHHEEIAARRRAMLALTGAALAGPLEDGQAAYNRGDYATALRLFRPLADKGDSDAQNALGIMYDLGRGVTQNHSE